MLRIRESAQGETTDENKGEPRKVWSQADFAAEYRKFNIDTTPKVCTCYILVI